MLLFNRLKDRLSHGARFRQLCQRNGLSLDYRCNRDALPVLEDIFHQRTYADYFPFYQPATVVDLGAHYGYFSLFAHQHLAPDARIISVEPSAENVAVLRDNLQRHMATNVHVIAAAVGAQSGTAKLYTGASMNHSLYSTRPGHGEQVRQMTLEELLEETGIGQIDFLKLDCEGAEYEVLLSLPDNIFRRIHTISMEFHDRKQSDQTAAHLVQRLEQAKYRIVRFEYLPTNFNQNYGRIVAVRSSAD